MKVRENPIGIGATGQLDAPFSEQIKSLHKRIVAADQSRETWLRKQHVLMAQRRGVRPPKKIPWEGANNDHIPLTDGVIRRWKPQMAALVLESDPVCYFKATKPEDIDAARSAQDYYNWRFLHISDLVKKVYQQVDMIAQYGIMYVRVGWHYRTEIRCRIIRADSLFPGGIEQAYQMLQEQIAAQAQQTQQPPPPVPSMEDFVTQTLQANYDLDETDVYKGQPQLNAAVAALLGGAKTFKIYTETVIEDRPDWMPVSPLQVIVPVVDRPLREQDFVAIIHRKTFDEIMDMAKAGLFVPEKIQEFDSARAKTNSESSLEVEGLSGPGSSSRTGIETTFARLDGVDRFSPVADREEPSRYALWEIYTRLMIDGELKRVVVWYQPTTKVILSVLDYPFPFHSWPVVLFEYESTADRPYQSRGIAEMLTTYQRLTCELHNARLDAIQIILSPMFTWRDPSQELRRNLRFRPGVVVPVQGGDDLKPVVQDHRSLMGFIQEEQLTKGLAEQLIGVYDQTMTQIQNPAERRTATEVQAMSSMVNTTFGQDAQMFQAGWAEVHEMLWQLILEFGPEEDYYRVQGDDVPRSIKKRDIARNFDIYPSGTPANTSKVLALARAREMLQIFITDQTGLVDKRELFKAYLDASDPLLAKRILRSIEAAAAIQKIMQLATMDGEQIAAP